jgi:hypothetical protein
MQYLCVFSILFAWVGGDGSYRKQIQPDGKGEDGDYGVTPLIVSTEKGCDVSRAPGILNRFQSPTSSSCSIEIFCPVFYELHSFGTSCRGKRKCI